MELVFGQGGMVKLQVSLSFCVLVALCLCMNECQGLHLLMLVMLEQITSGRLPWRVVVMLFMRLLMMSWFRRDG